MGHADHRMHENSLRAWVESQEERLTRREIIAELIRRSHEPLTDRQVLEFMIGDDLLPPGAERNEVSPSITALLADGELTAVDNVKVGKHWRRRTRTATPEEFAAFKRERVLDHGIIRMARRRRFVVIDAEAAENREMSFRARGLLLWLLAKPDDWVVRPRSLHNFAKEGRDACLAAFKELIEAGYIVVTKESVHGQPPQPCYTVHESPLPGNPAQGPSPEPEKPAAENPQPENPALPNTQGLPSNQDSEQGIDDAMEAVEDDQQHPKPPPPGPVDLQQMRLVRLTSEQDRIDVQDLLDRFGFEAVRDAATRIASGQSTIPYPSQLTASMAGTPFNRRRAIDELRAAMRVKYDISNYVSNALLETLLLRGSNVGRELRACIRHHGAVTKAWIEESIKDGTIVLAVEERTDQSLAQMLERARSVGT